MTASELIAAVTPFFTFIGAIQKSFDEMYFFGVSWGTILYGIGFVSLTIYGYHRITSVKSSQEE